jgi:hypothetical protein
VDAAVLRLILDERDDNAASTTSFDFVYVDPKDAGQQLKLAAMHCMSNGGQVPLEAHKKGATNEASDAKQRT